MRTISSRRPMSLTPKFALGMSAINGAALKKLKKGGSLLFSVGKEALGEIHMELRNSGRRRRKIFKLRETVRSHAFHGLVLK